MFKNAKTKIKQLAVLAAVTTLPAFAMANGGSPADVGQQIAQAVAGFAVTISAIGVAGVAVVVAMRSFSLGYSMMQKIRG